MAASAAAVTGQERVKYFKRPLVPNVDHVLYYRAQEEPNRLVLQDEEALHVKGSVRRRRDKKTQSAAAKTRVQSTQTAYRDSEAQTEPCTIRQHELVSGRHHLMRSGAPELVGLAGSQLLSLDLMVWGRDLPARTGDTLLAAAELRDQGERAGRMIKAAEAREDKRRRKKELKIKSPRLPIPLTSPLPPPVPKAVSPFIPGPITQCVSKILENRHKMETMLQDNFLRKVKAERIVRLEEALEEYSLESARWEQDRQEHLAIRLAREQRTRCKNFSRERRRKEAALVRNHQLAARRMDAKRAESSPATKSLSVVNRGKTFLDRRAVSPNGEEGDFASVLGRLSSLDKKLTRELESFRLPSAGVGASGSSSFAEKGKSSSSTYLPRRQQYDHLLDTVSREIQAAKRKIGNNEKEQLEDYQAGPAEALQDKDEGYRIHLSSDEDDDDDGDIVCGPSLDELVLSVLRNAVRDLQADLLRR